MMLDDAQHKADEVVRLISPFCVKDHCKIVGSVRRRVPNPGDIEVCAIPDLTDPDKFNAIIRILKEGELGAVESGMFPARYTKLKGSLCNIDLFWQSRESWGLNVWIRTGPEDYVHRGLAFWKQITNGGYSEGARLFLADGTYVPTLTEESVFEAFEKYAKRPVKWIEPSKRGLTMPKPAK